MKGQKTAWGSVGVRSGIGSGGMSVSGPIVRHGGGGGIGGIGQDQSGGGGGGGVGGNGCPAGCNCHPAWYAGTALGIVLLVTALFAR